MSFIDDLFGSEGTVPLYGSGNIFSQASDTLFGDVTGEGQAEAQRLENLAKQEFIKQQADQARGDIFKLFPAAEQARQLGTQGALDIFGQTIPQQMDVFQQGNVGAQQALTQGLPQILAALRGTPIDLSQLQPQTLSFDPSFAQQQLPQFQSTTSALGLSPPAFGGGPVNVGANPVGLGDFSGFGAGSSSTNTPIVNLLSGRSVV